MKKVGLLAIQGDYAAHGMAIRRAGGEPIELRSLEDIEAADAIILPGGESTVIGGLLLRFGLLEPLKKRIQEGLPVFGTCAGLILLAAKVEGRSQPGLGVLDVTVLRNAYGRQIDSFRAGLSTNVPGAEELEGVFIRAPKITRIGEGVEVLARYEGDPVIVRQGNILGSTFHPELSESAAIHRWFLGFY